MRYFIIAGEASGDLHGSYLIRALQKLDPEASFAFLGGDQMAEAAKASPRLHISNLSFMGVWEVFLHIRELRAYFKQCKSSIRAFAPHAIVLIDYPGFNLKIAAWAKKHGYNVQYYISPKLWAWNKGRIKKLRAYVDHLYTILPFESEFYQNTGVPFTYVGNPLVEQIATYKAHIPPAAAPSPPLIALLPGSRIQEVRRILPVMLDVVEQFPNYRFVIAGMELIPQKVYREILDRHPAGKQIHLVFNQTYDILATATVGLITSGTSTLEAALFGLPQVVCYRTSTLNYVLAKSLLKIKYISLVNLIMNAPTVRELIQGALNSQTLEQAINALLSPDHRQQLDEAYAVLTRKLGEGSASLHVARGILKSIASHSPSPPQEEQ